MNDLEWLIEHCLSVNIEVNIHRDYHQTAEQSIIEDKEKRVRLYALEPEEEAECIRRDSIVHLHVYPRTPVTFYTVTHYDIRVALHQMREVCEKDGTVR